jgi:hypothetical protein
MVSTRIVPREGSRIVRLYVDLTGKRVRVSREPEQEPDEYGGGQSMWTTQVYVQDESGGEVITVATTGKKPDVTVDAIVVPVALEVVPWCRIGNGHHRSGIAYRARELTPPGGVTVA